MSDSTETSTIKRIEEIKLKKGTRVLVVSSPLPEATLSSALLCRAISKSNGLFHMRFVDAITHAQEINSLFKTYRNYTPVIIGVEIIGERLPKRKRRTPIVIGGDIHVKDSQFSVLGKDDPLSSTTYYLAENNFSIGPVELQLAAIGALVELNINLNFDDKYPEIVKTAIKEGILSEKKGLKIFGSNFLPLNESLMYNIHPYLQGVSGSPKLCDKILDDADIPLTKRRTPMTTLTIEEQQQLTTQLIPKLTPITISRVLGMDFIAHCEKDGGFLQFVSTVPPIAETAWNREELGMLFSIWLGDRARILRSFLDSHMLHCKGVIAGIEKVSDALKENIGVDDNNLVVNVQSVGLHNTILPSIGRIVFESEYISKEKIMILTTEVSTEIAWASNNIEMFDAFSILEKKGVNSIPTSKKSLRVNNTSQNVVEKISKSLEILLGDIDSN